MAEKFEIRRSTPSSRIGMLIFAVLLVAGLAGAAHVGLGVARTQYPLDDTLEFFRIEAINWERNRIGERGGVAVPR